MNTLRNFAKFVLLVFSRNLNISRKIYINGISRSRALKWYIICSYFKSLIFLDTHSRAVGESFCENLLINSRNQNIFEKFKLNRNLQTIPFKMMYNMSMLRHRFSNERWGIPPWTTFLSYSVRVCIKVKYKRSTSEVQLFGTKEVLLRSNGSLFVNESRVRGLLSFPRQGFNRLVQSSTKHTIDCSIQFSWRHSSLDGTSPEYRLKEYVYKS